MLIFPLEILRFRKVANHHQNQAVQKGLYLLLFFEGKCIWALKTKKGKPQLRWKSLSFFYDFDGNDGGRNVAYIEILSLVGATATFWNQALILVFPWYSKSIVFLTYFEAFWNYYEIMNSQKLEIP